MNVFGDWNVPRTRAVGHDDMLDAVSSPNIPNGLGYAFYSIGTFSKRNHINYLTVDGVDPLYGTPSGGVFPLCTGFINSTPMFSRILEVHRARVLASLVRSSFKLGTRVRFPLPRRRRLRNSFGAQAQRSAEAANGGHWTWLSYRDAQGPEEVRRASVKRIVIEEMP